MNDSIKTELCPSVSDRFALFSMFAFCLRLPPPLSGRRGGATDAEQQIQLQNENIGFIFDFYISIFNLFLIDLFECLFTNVLQYYLVRSQ